MSATIMLAIIGPNWVDARDEKTGNRRIDDPEDWVRVEIERALAQKIPVIPVLVAGATLPSKSDLPQSLQPLLDHHSATVTTRHGVAGLARDVADLTMRRPWGRIAAAASALTICRTPRWRAVSGVAGRRQSPRPWPPLDARLGAPVEQLPPPPGPTSSPASTATA
jgi:hypothetical protein